MFSLRCHETSLSAAYTSGLRSAPPHRYFDAIKCCWLEPPHPPPPTHPHTPPHTLLHFVDLPRELLFAHRQNSSEAPEITITAHMLSTDRHWVGYFWKFPLLQVLPKHEIKFNENPIFWSKLSLFVSPPSPPPPLACWLGVSKKVSVHCSPLFIAQQ